MTQKIYQLNSLPQPQRLTRLNSFPGGVHGVSLLTTGPALGHPFEVDKKTVEQVAEHAQTLKGRWTHGSLSDDGLARHLGRWENVQAESFLLCRPCNAEVETETCFCGEQSEQAWRTVGDFFFAESAYSLKPDGLKVPAPVYLMERAEEDPSSLGISVVARFSFEESEDEGETRRFARIPEKKALLRADWVADPAANPIGLHQGTGAPSELTEAATQQLDRIVTREGKQKARLRALSFLARYFGDEGDDEEDSGGENLREAQLDELRAEISQLKLELKVNRAREQERRDQEKADLLKQLKAETVALNAPIPAADLAKVEELLERGDLNTAKTLGEAFLARSKAQGQKPFERSGVHSLGEEDNRQKGSVSAQARMLRRRGWKVEVSEKGDQLLSCIPPNEHH